MTGQSPGADPPRDIRSIQYLRAVAALMVVWHHAAGQVAGVGAFFPSSFGTSGVDLFFVISGFIMFVTTSGRSAGPMEFWRRRVVRVVPLYWLLTLAMVGAALVAPGLFKTLQVEAGTLLKSLFFVPHYSHSFPDQAWPLLVPGWTLNFEMFFYAVFGAALWAPEPWRLAIFSACMLALVAFGWLWGPFTSAAARTYTHPMLLEFLAGVWLGAVWRRGYLRGPVVLSAAAVVAGGALLVSRGMPGPAYAPQIVGAALVVAGALHPRFSAWSSRVWHAIGDSSYSLYLTHLFTLGALRVVWVKLVPGPVDTASASGFMVLALTASASVGWLVYRHFEQPMLRRLQHSGPARARPASLNPAKVAATARSTACEP